MSRTIHDVLSESVNPGDLSQADCLEMARCSLLKQIRAGMPLWEKPFADLSGGWDPRAVVSSLCALGAQFSASVTGQEELRDVIVASKLAKIAGFDLRVIGGWAGLPADTPEECRRRISLALLWQAGYIVNHQHKEFLSNYTHLGGGKLDIMGARGEIGRGVYSKMIKAESLDEREYEEQLITKLMGKIPPLIRQGLHDRIREMIQEAYRQADRFGLTRSCSNGLLVLVRADPTTGFRLAQFSTGHRLRALSQSRLYPRDLRLSGLRKGNQSLPPVYHRGECA
jgi:hypothetical protein